MKQKIRMAFLSKQPIIARGRPGLNNDRSIYEVRPDWSVIETVPGIEGGTPASVPPNEESVIDFLIEKGVRGTGDIKLKIDQDF